jgi:hypothetical protein
VLPDQAVGILVADRNCGCALETLLTVEKVEPGIAALIDPKTFHPNVVSLAGTTFDNDSIG